MADTPQKGAGLAMGAAGVAGVAAIAFGAFFLTQSGPPAPANLPEPLGGAPAAAAPDSNSANVQPAQFGQGARPTPPSASAPGTGAMTTSPDGSSISFSDESLSFSASLPQGPASDPALTYLRRDSQAYLNKMKTNARADYDRLKRTGDKPGAWEVRVRWAYTAKAGDIVSLAGEASEYNGGAHPMQYFDTHTARTSGDQLKLSDMLLAKASPSPAITVAICEALKVAKQARIKSATIFEEPIVCVGSAANAKTEEAKIALAPSNRPDRFGGLYVYYDPYMVGAYAEGGYKLTVQQEVFAEDLRPQFKALFGGEAPALAN